MANVNPKRASPFLPKSIKEEEEDEGGEMMKEEEPSLPLVPQPVQEEISMVFNTYNTATTNLTPSLKRKKGVGQEGMNMTFYIDRRKSKVWNYYTKLGDAYVECNICKKQLSFHNSTTTMREHLVRKHSMRNTLLSQLKDDQLTESDYPAQESVAKRCRQTTPESGFNHGASCSEPRNDVMVELVLEMIFRDLQPLSVVKDKGFGLLVGFLEPGFALPSPAQLAGKLRQRYNVVKQHLERYLQTAQSMVVCVEFWISQLGWTYRTVTANFIDEEWRRARCGLETRQADGDEADFGEKLHNILSEFGLSGKAVSCVMHNTPGSAAESRWHLEKTPNWSSLCCAARTLHLCIQTGLEVEQVQEALSIARGIVRFFQQDAKATCSLNSKLEAINKTKLKLVVDVVSRWVTTMEMCENLLDLKWAIMSVLEEHPKGVLVVQNLADHQWKLLQDLVLVMRTIKIATSFLGEEQNVSISSLMPCVHGIISTIGQQAEEVGAAIKMVIGNIRSELTRRWGLAEEEKVLENPAVIASFLDPRFKEMRFLSPNLRSELHQRVKNLLSQLFHQQSPSAPQFWVPNSDHKAEGGDTGSQLPAHKDRCSSSTLQSIYDLLLGKDPTESMPEIHQQLENYIVEPLCKRSTNPLDWWKNNEHRFPAV
ncbi:zinc finger BED domain-containing protein 1-like, partial [Antrostomus carolinensis]|uniref:zinc finger BED domain-containing protein 1-like n=1 Tax=Antrostomus carolinensis TaxID=279965 RepID=UPI00052884C9